MTDDGRRRRPTKATTDDDDDRRQRRPATADKISRPLILPKISNLRKIASFLKNSEKFDFFQRSLPWTKKGNDGRRRRPTKATTDDDDDRRRRRPATAEKSRPLILPKILNLRKIESFLKHRENLIFFQRSLPWTTDDGDDDRRRRRKISSTHFAENLEFEKNCEFFENSENLIFFKGPSLGRKREMTDDGRRRRPTKATTDDDDDRRRRRPATAEKSRPLILPKISNLRKIASFLKTAKNLIFFKGPSLGRKREMTDDGQRRRPTTATTDDDDDRRQRRPATATKSSSTHFAENLEFEKNCEFLKNSENLIFFKGPSLGRKREMTDDGRRRRPTTATTDDDDDRRQRRPATAEKSRPLILPKILNLRKIESF